MSKSKEGQARGKYTLATRLAPIDGRSVLRYCQTYGIVIHMVLLDIFGVKAR